MTIVWGHNNYRLKVVQPHEIALFDEGFKNITFELRQKYGHLFWIPFIPLGKVWTVNKGDGKKYVCHEDIVERLNQLHLGKSKNSIFAWSGFLLIILGFIIFSISEKLDNIRWEKQEHEAYNSKIEGLENQISKLTANEYLIFNKKENGDGYYTSDRTPLKVLKVNGDKILLGSWPDTYKKKYEMSDEENLAALVNNFPVQDSFWINRNNLKNAINKDISSKNFQGISLKTFPASTSFKLYEIIDGPTPVLRINYKSEANSKLYVEIINIGLDAQADSIVSLTNGITWQLSKRKSLKKDESIAVKASDVGDAVLYCSDKNKKKYSFYLKNNIGWVIDTKE